MIRTWCALKAPFLHMHFFDSSIRCTKIDCRFVCETNVLSDTMQYATLLLAHSWLFFFCTWSTRWTVARRVSISCRFMKEKKECNQTRRSLLVGTGGIEE